MSINERIKKVREALKLTQIELANKIGIGQSTVADVERGRIYPNPYYIERLHENFDINLNWLICGSGKMKLESTENQQTHFSIVEEPKSDYANIKDKYIKALEDFSQLQAEHKLAIEKLAWYDLNCDCAKTKQTEKSA